MKTIIYSLIAIFIFSIVATGFTNRANTNSAILFQSVESNVSADLLSQSAQIISERLKAFSSEKFEVSIIPEKNQIKVELSNQWNLNIVENLIVQKGTMAFYEAFNRKGLIELLNNDNQLFSLFNEVDVNSSGAKIGCTSITEIDKVNNYLSSTGINQKCKFAWGQLSENSELCLYALKPDIEKNALLTGTDIESIQTIGDKSSDYFNIEIKFKKPAVKTWSDATKRNINKAIAIVLDNQVIYAPVVKTEINNGICSISGKFTEDQAKYLSAILTYGELPLSFKVVK